MKTAALDGKGFSVEADCNEMGKESEYENAIDRFVFWCDVDFDINGEEYKAVAQFDCGYKNDVGKWSEIDSSLLDVSDAQDSFIANLLDAAVKAMRELKESMLELA